MSVKQQRKGVLRLMFLALAVFALTLATRADEEREPGPEVPAVPSEVVEVRTPGARALVPAGSPSGEALPVQQFLADARPELETCLHRWWMLQPGLSGRVDVVLEVGPEGLSQAWVEDVATLEEPVATCLSEVLWTRPLHAEVPSTLTWTFEVQ